MRYIFSTTLLLAILALLFALGSTQLTKLISIQQNEYLTQNEEGLEKITSLLQDLEKSSFSNHTAISLLEEYSSKSETDVMGAASYNLAILYKSSRYEKNWDKYKNYIVKAAMRGSFYAFMDMAFMLENKWIQDVSILNRYMKESGDIVDDEYVGFNSKMDLNSVAMMYYMAAALNGHPLAQMVVGYRHDQGYKLKRSCENAALWYEKAAESALETLRNFHTSLFPYEGRLKVFGGKDDLYRQKMKDVLDYYTYAAGKDGGETQVLLGYAHLYGIREIPKNPTEALSLFQQAIRMGEKSAYSPLGKMYAYGLGVEQNDATALMYYREGVKKGDPESMNGLGVMYLKGQGVEQDIVKAHNFFNRSALAGIPEAQYNMGLLHLTGDGVPKDLRKSYEYMTQSAQQGFPLAQYYLGKMHLYGWGVAKSCQGAVRFLKHVAERGHTSPLLDVAYEKYLENKYDEALLFYHQLSATGDEYAIQNAAHFFDKKLGTDFLFTNAIQSTKTRSTANVYADNCAFLLNHEAAKVGVVDSMIRVGDYYYYGKGTHVDYEQSTYFYKMSLMKNSPRGAFNLGYSYEHGIGVEKSFELARKYYDMAIQFDASSYIPSKLAITKLLVKTASKAFQNRLLGGVTFKDFSTEDAEKSKVENERNLNQRIHNFLSTVGNPKKLWEFMRRNEYFSIGVLLVMFVILGFIRTIIEGQQRRNRMANDILQRGELPRNVVNIDGGDNQNGQ